MKTLKTSGFLMMRLIRTECRMGTRTMNLSKNNYYSAYSILNYFFFHRLLCSIIMIVRNDKKIAFNILSANLKT